MDHVKRKHTDFLLTCVGFKQYLIQIGFIFIGHYLIY